MATYEVARMAARQAIGVLQSEGSAEARKGAGVFARGFRPLSRQGSGRPWSLVCRTAFAADGHPVEVNEMTLDAASYVLECAFDV